MGSEMCIRDSIYIARAITPRAITPLPPLHGYHACLYIPGYHAIVLCPIPGLSHLSYHAPPYTYIGLSHPPYLVVRSLPIIGYYATCSSPPRTRLVFRRPGAGVHRDIERGKVPSATTAVSPFLYCFTMSWGVGGSLRACSFLFFGLGAAAVAAHKISSEAERGTVYCFFLLRFCPLHCDASDVYCCCCSSLLLFLSFRLRCFGYGCGLRCC